MCINYYRDRIVFLSPTKKKEKQLLESRDPNTLSYIVKNLFCRTKKTKHHTSHHYKLVKLLLRGESPVRGFYSIKCCIHGLQTSACCLLCGPHSSRCVQGLASKRVFSYTSKFQKVLQYMSHRMFTACAWSIKCR